MTARRQRTVNAYKFAYVVSDSPDDCNGIDIFDIQIALLSVQERAKA